ncbi:MAG: hypothetical protein ACI8UP_004327 [Porticoccaceae bacterium]|jgi:hypothetical protein
MPRRSVLSSSDRESLLALPERDAGMIRYYSFSGGCGAHPNQTWRYKQAGVRCSVLPASLSWCCTSAWSVST